MSSDIFDRNSSQETGRLVLKYLHQNKDGATLSQIVEHLNEEYGKGSTDDLNKTVQSVLDHGAAFGFLERKGSQFINWLAKEADVAGVEEAVVVAVVVEEVVLVVVDEDVVVAGVVVGADYQSRRNRRLGSQASRTETFYGIFDNLIEGTNNGINYGIDQTTRRARSTRVVFYHPAESPPVALINSSVLNDMPQNSTSIRYFDKVGRIPTGTGNMGPFLGSTCGFPFGSLASGSAGRFGSPCLSGISISSNVAKSSPAGSSPRYMLNHSREGGKSGFAYSSFRELMWGLANARPMNSDLPTLS
ncbi:unnamed protein product [Leptidea sinapis]|uniref:DUF4777 domain-containing protein n=1 Tax=Leptidea sinapis TaxID=189913 RepID=A0A5E4QPA1_9NEOP|nr:unnamed protein product [Leptidea sinapis]